MYTLKDTYVTSSVHYDIIDAAGNPGNPRAQGDLLPGFYLSPNPTLGAGNTMPQPTAFTKHT